jgi:hypothetical protein
MDMDQLTVPDILEMDCDELRAELKSRALLSSGRKTDLQARLIQSMGSPRQVGSIIFLAATAGHTNNLFV